MPELKIEKKTFKRLLLLNQWMDFEIIIQECSLDDPPPKLLKPMNKMAARDINRKKLYMLSSPEPVVGFYSS